MDARIIAGPRKIGNVFGYFGPLVPEGKFAIVTDGEYTNEGSGPSSVDGKLYVTAEAARAALDLMTNPPGPWTVYNRALSGAADLVPEPVGTTSAAALREAGCPVYATKAEAQAAIDSGTVNADFAAQQAANAASVA